MTVSATTPIVAQCRSIRPGMTRVYPGTFPIFTPAMVEFDTLGPDGIFVIYDDGTPSGNIYFRQTGYWRISGQVYFLPDPAVNSSMYFGMWDIGTSGLENNGPLFSANGYLPNANHPSIDFNFIAKIDKQYQYYQPRIYYLTTDTPYHDLAVGENYNHIAVEYLGPL